MARILTALATLRRETDNNLAAPALPDIAEVCRARGHAYRERLLTPMMTLQLFCLQVLHGNTAIAHLRQLAGVNFSPSSYSDARKRIPLVVFQDVLEHMAKLFLDAMTHIPVNILSKRRVIVVDAVTFSMPDTPELCEHFGLPTGQEVGVGYPVGKVMALLDYDSGMFTRLLPMPLFTHDMRGVMGLHAEMKKGDILLGDTAFCSFVHMFMLAAAGVDGVFHLHQRRPKVAGIQRWERPAKPPAWMSVEQFNTLPEHIDIRVVEHRVEQKGFRTNIIFIATTLMDEKAWPDEVIADLYMKRWDIEVCFDHLKTTMNMNVLKCGTVEGVLKELAVYLIVYNRVRQAMLEAAERQGVDPRRISFVDALRRWAVRLTGLPGVEELIVNPHRPDRAEPRVRRRRPKSYPWMMKPRRVLKEALFAA